MQWKLVCLRWSGIAPGPGDLGILKIKFDTCHQPILVNMSGVLVIQFQVSKYCACNPDIYVSIRLDHPCYWPHLHLNNFVMILYLYIVNYSRVIHAYRCANPVELPRVAGARPMSSDSTNIGPIPAWLWCVVARPLGYGSKWWNVVKLHWLYDSPSVTSSWWWCMR